MKQHTWELTVTAASAAGLFLRAAFGDFLLSSLGCWIFISIIITIIIIIIFLMIASDILYRIAVRHGFGDGRWGMAVVDRVRLRLGLILMRSDAILRQIHRTGVTITATSTSRRYLSKCTILVYSSDSNGDSCLPTPTRFVLIFYYFSVDWIPSLSICLLNVNFHISLFSWLVSIIQLVILNCPSSIKNFLIFFYFAGPRHP